MCDTNFLLKNMNLDKYKSKFKYLRQEIGIANNILEIGGHYGEDTIRLNHFFPEANIYCFEPDPRNINIIKKHKIDLHPKIELIEKAISIKNENNVTFYQSFKEYDKSELPNKYKFIDLNEYKSLKLNNSGSSSLMKYNKNDLNFNTTTVNTIRLDDWLIKKNINNIDFIWIDVQGAEKDVINSLGESTKKVKFIQMEYGETGYDNGMSKNETLEFMKSKGFKLKIDYNPNMNTGDFLFQNYLE